MFTPAIISLFLFLIVFLQPFTRFPPLWPLAHASSPVWSSWVSHKSQKIAALIRSFEKGPFDPHYLGYFDCFNQQLFFEAHDVLEEIWLQQRGKENDLFYKGLIQLAGAFVHIQKRRPQPALALFELARKNLNPFLPRRDGLDIRAVLELVSAWSGSLQSDPAFCDKVLKEGGWPRLTLVSSDLL